MIFAEKKKKSSCKRGWAHIIDGHPIKDYCFIQIKAKSENDLPGFHANQNTLLGFKK